MRARGDAVAAAAAAAAAAWSLLTRCFSVEGVAARGPILPFEKECWIPVPLKLLDNCFSICKKRRGLGFRVCDEK